MMKFSLPTAFGKKVTLVIGLAVLSAFQAQAFDKAHLLKLKAVNACVDCDLRGDNLSKANLSRANLRGTNRSAEQPIFKTARRALSDH